jgi:hypothetical protein
MSMLEIYKENALKTPSSKSKLNSSFRACNYDEQHNIAGT